MQIKLKNLTKKNMKIIEEQEKFNTDTKHTFGLCEGEPSFHLGIVDIENDDYYYVCLDDAAKNWLCYTSCVCDFLPLKEYLPSDKYYDLEVCFLFNFLIRLSYAISKEADIQNIKLFIYVAKILIENSTEYSPSNLRMFRGTVHEIQEKEAMLEKLLLEKN